MPDQPVPQGVGITALGVARARATESCRPDHLFTDELAQAFVDAATPALATSAPSTTTSSSPSIDLRPMIDSYVAIRTRYFDDYLLRACQAGVRQVVVLGAGLDVRAFRLDWPAGLHLFEVDQADVFRFKEPIIAERGAAPRCIRGVVTADLRENWPTALAASGFETAQATAWLMEGLLMYLTEPARDGLMADVGRFSTPGSWLGIEPPAWTVPGELAPSLALGRADSSMLELASAGVAASSALRSVVAPADWLASHGWVAQLTEATMQFSTYGRAMPPEVRNVMGNPRRWLATAQRAPRQLSSQS